MMKFNEKYSPDNFLQFLQDFLPMDFVEKEETITIDKTRYKEIYQAKILGYCESLDLHVLEMDHTRETDPRVTIASDAFKILADHWMHKALIVFKNNESDNYRLSYLTISLDLNDKNKAVKKYSNARRYSFYLGSGARVRTPEQQLLKKGRVENAEDLLSRFSVEVVNKQFYLEVAKYFDQLVLRENLSLPSVSEENVNVRKSFAVRLIGRLMFCWFLKQKKSAGGQLIPDELLSSAVVGSNYYHNIVEPLFFGVLNTSIDSRDIRSDLFDKVPYLNGGLFNPQSEDYYELDRDIFVSKYLNTLKISDSWFKGFFELLETYNFTIDENTVFDQELSVDPEMLGRIFENLLAEINPETGSSERKRTGSFYTPRQIVEYMVDQSLIEHFKTKTDIVEKKIAALVSYDLADDSEYPLLEADKVQIINAIDSLKILDPACGSGAFPIGALQKIVYILQQIDPDCKLWLEEKLKNVPELYKQKIINEVKSNPFDYTRKLDVIKNSIFGVDIQPIAVDVSRLRCFLTLVVESEIDDTKYNRGIEPLPNLDFKFVCANTLIGLPINKSDSLFEDHSGIVALSKIMSEYFSCNSQRKNEIKLKFINLQKEIFEKTVLAFGSSTGELTMKLITWNPFANASNSWFDSEWMFGLQEKFDIVIGNPPYKFLSGKGSPVKQLEKLGKLKEADELKAELDNLAKIYSKTSVGCRDYYKWFIEAGVNMVKNGGTLSFITPNTYLSLSSYKDIRQLLLGELRCLKVVDLGFGIFEDPIVPSAIFLVQKSDPNNQSIDYSDLKTFTGEDLRDPGFDRLWEENRTRITYQDGKLLLYKNSVAEKIYTKFQLTLKDLLSISEGEHSINNDFSNDYEAGIPVIYDKKLFKYTVPEIRFLPSSFCPKFSEDFHTGERFFIRKTGDSILALPFPNGTFAIAHQNLYVAKPVSAGDSLFLVALLSSKLLTFLYQNGIYGQKGRTLAQFRVYALYELPIPEISTDIKRVLTQCVKEIIALKSKHTDTGALENQVDQIVYNLYGLTSEEIEIVKADQ